MIREIHREMLAVFLLVVLAGAPASVSMGSRLEDIERAREHGAEQAEGALIEKALDGPAAINLTKVTLAEALAEFSGKMAVTIDIDEPAMGKLPHGRLTELASVQLEDLSWREALSELLKPLALRFQTGQGRIFILGTAELLRQPRRLRLTELDALVKLQNNTLTDEEEKLLKQLREVTGVRFGLVVNGRRREKADRDITKEILNDTHQRATRMLDLYCRALARRGPMTWYIQAQGQNGTDRKVDIVILRYVDLMAMKLDQQISIEFSSQPVLRILHELAQAGGVSIRFEPGCLALLDEDLRENCSLVLRSGTIRSALEALASMTGLVYSVKEDGIGIAASENLRASAAARAQQTTRATRSPLACVLMAELPGTELETMIFVRHEDLEEEGLLETFEQIRKERVGELLDFLRGQRK